MNWILNLLLLATVGTCWLWILVVVARYHDGEKIPANGLSYKDNPFNYHPFLLVTSFVGINFFSVTLFTTSNNYLQHKNKLKILHLILQGIVLVLAWIGIEAIDAAHENEDPKPRGHQSIHSWLGTAAFLMFIFQFFISFLTFTFPGATLPRRKLLIVYHRVAGLIILIFIVASVVTGIQENLAHANSCDAIHAVDDDDDDDRMLHEGHEVGRMSWSCIMGNSLGVLVVFSGVGVLMVLVGTQIGTARPGLSQKNAEFEALDRDFEIGSDDSDDELQQA